MAETLFMGVPRGEIPWAPAIDYAKCDFCMECDDFCPHRVFKRQEKDPKLVVQNPDNCVVFCRACAKTCGPDAISFPEKPVTVALIKRLRDARADERGAGA
jgi:NAD-dependent dihydropyrimidine dehydrogenase PreA subunit